jgi:hypothetical protein
MIRDLHGFSEELVELYRKVFPEQNASVEELEYYAWPEVFASTSGPYGGIGGAMMTTYTVEALYNGLTGTTLYVCANTYQKSRGPFKPLETPRFAWTPFIT